MSVVKETVIPKIHLSGAEKASEQAPIRGTESGGTSSEVRPL